VILLIASPGERKREVGPALNECGVKTSELFLKTLCLLLACVLASAAAQAVNAAGRPVSHMHTILFLGDSLTDGYGLERAQAYPALIAEKMRAAGYRFEVINAGVSGDTTAGGLRRLPKYLHRKIDVLVVELGINDAFRGIPLEQVRTNLQAIIDRMKKKNPAAQVIIAGMQLPFVGEDGYVRDFGELFRTLAEKNHAALIPYLLEGVGGDPTLNIGDHIHPNAAGQRVLTDTVWKTLEPLLR
jgi:acyl-CoA thioesterase-1